MFGRRTDNGDGAAYVDLRKRRSAGSARKIADDHRRVLDLLDAGGVTPTSVREMEEAGVANPAAVVYELELSGVAVERVYGTTASHQRRLMGFRLAGSAQPRQT